MPKLSTKYSAPIYQSKILIKPRACPSLRLFFRRPFSGPTYASKVSYIIKVLAAFLLENILADQYKDILFVKVTMVKTMAFINITPNFMLNLNICRLLMFVDFMPASYSTAIVAIACLESSLDFV